MPCPSRIGTNTENKMSNFSTYKSKSKKVRMNYSRYIYIDIFGYFLIMLVEQLLRISPGQVQNNQTFGVSLVSVKSIEKVTSTREQVKKYCNWRKESSLRL